MSPAEQYQLRAYALQPVIDHYQAIAENPHDPDREYYGQRALGMRAALYAMRVEAQHG